MTDDLVSFLRERLDERESSARFAGTRGAGPTWRTEECEQCGGHIVGSSGTEHAETVVDCYPYEGGGLVYPVHHFMVENDPQYVLADIEAKRRIVDELHRIPGDGINFAIAEQNRADDVLRLLALPYSDHPDYRSDWAP